MQALAQTVGIPYDDFKCLFCIVVQIPLSYLYRKLPAVTDSNLFWRKMFGVAVAFFTNLYCFGGWGLTVLFLSTLLSYALAMQATTKRRAFQLSFVSFSFLCLANLIRLVVDYEGNSNNVSLLFMILTPRIIYFIWTVCRKHEDKHPEQIPSLTDYLCYLYNYLGGMVGPVYSYEEWDHFIRQTFPESAINVPELLRAVRDVVLCFALYALGPILFDSSLLEKPRFRELNVVLQVGVITIEAVILRARYVIAWRLESIQVILANVRDSESQYREHVQTISVQNVELENSTKIRIDNWNISIQKWLKNCIYLPSKDTLRLSSRQASMLTFVVSAFWHGFYPTYYFSFVAWNFVMEAEKLVYNCPALFAVFPSFYFRFLLDLHGLLFKRYLTANWLAMFWNVKWFVAMNFVGYGVLKVVVPILNKKYGGRKDKHGRDGVLKGKEDGKSGEKAVQEANK